MITESKLQPRPFVKWAGGKQSIANKIILHFPSQYEKYFEPFIGGGSVFFSSKANKAVISDYNEWLITTYKAIRDFPLEVMEKLESYPNTEDYYYKIRSNDVSKLDLVEKASHFIYLNKTCFRGLFRVNKKGQFNVPYGRYQRKYFDRNEILTTSEYLRNIEIRCGDYELSLHDIGKEDFVYLDPPYFKQGGYSDFNRYTKDKFNHLDQIRLASVCQDLNKKGVRFLQSNSNTPFIRELYSDFKLIEIENRREINLKSSKRQITELLIKNY